MCHLKPLLNLVILMGLLMIGCSTQSDDIGAETTLSPDLAQFRGSVARAAGKIVPVQQASLSFPMAGQVVELSVKEGDMVRAGDVLARLDTTILNSEVARAEAALVVAQANLDRVNAGAHEAEIAEAESQILLAAAESQYARAVAQARLDYLLAQPLPVNIAVAEAEVELAKAYARVVKAQLDQAVIIAPFDGTVTTVFINSYEYASPGQPVVHIGNLSTFCIEITDLDEFDVARIAVGDVAVVTFNALPGVEVKGSVKLITPQTVEGGDIHFTVVVELSEVPESILWGMTAYVDILPK